MRTGVTLQNPTPILTYHFNSRGNCTYLQDYKVKAKMSSGVFRSVRGRKQESYRNVTFLYIVFFLQSVRARVVRQKHTVMCSAGPGTNCCPKPKTDTRWYAYKQTTYAYRRTCQMSHICWCFVSTLRVKLRAGVPENIVKNKALHIQGRCSLGHKGV
jgi:hypothetical protein